MKKIEMDDVRAAILRASSPHPLFSEENYKAWEKFHEEQMQFYKNMGEQLLPELSTILMGMNLLEKRKAEVLASYEFFHSKFNEHNDTLIKLHGSEIV